MRSKIGNKNKDKFELSCCLCGTRTDLAQVAHRNSLGFIIGYLFACNDCLLIIGGKYIVEIKVGAKI